MTQIPKKRYFKIGEVAKLTGVEPYTIRYWEKEFDQLKPVRAGSSQRLYKRDDIKKIMEINKLVHGERYTIAGAKEKLKKTDEQPAEQAAENATPHPDQAPTPIQIDETESHPDLFAGLDGALDKAVTMTAAPVAPAPNVPDSELPSENRTQPSETDRALLLEIRDELQNILKLLK